MTLLNLPLITAHFAAAAIPAALVLAQLVWLRRIVRWWPGRKGG